MPVHDPILSWLTELVESVRAQEDADWLLVLVADGMTRGACVDVAAAVGVGGRVSLLELESNVGAATASQHGAASLTCDWLVFVDQDDVLPRGVFESFRVAVATCPQALVVYFDEDKFERVEAGGAVGVHDVVLKPDWSPDSLLSHQYTGHGVFIRCSLFEAVRGFTGSVDGAHDYDLMLRVAAAPDVRRRPELIVHVPRIGYHWRAHPDSSASGVHVKPWAYEADRMVLDRALASLSDGAFCEPIASFPGLFLPRFPLGPVDPPVSIVVPTRDNARLLRRCLASVFESTEYGTFDVVVVDNGSVDPEVALVLEEYRERYPERVRVLRRDEPFNFSKLCNDAVQELVSDVVVFLNDDVEVVEPRWLRLMVEQAMRDGVGAVGALLVYPDRRVQHAGVVMGLGGTCAHSHRLRPFEGAGYGHRLRAITNYLAVTGACLAVRRSCFLAVGSFDEDAFPVEYSDVELCLRLHAAGYRNLVVPSAVLVHQESATRDVDSAGSHASLRSAEAQLKARWAHFIDRDPFYHPLLTRDREDFSFADGRGSAEAGVFVDISQSVDATRHLWSVRPRRNEPAPSVVAQLVIESVVLRSGRLHLSGWCRVGRERPTSVVLRFGRTRARSTLAWLPRPDVADHHQLTRDDIGFAMIAGVRRIRTNQNVIIDVDGIRFDLGPADRLIEEGHATDRSVPSVRA